MHELQVTEGILKIVLRNAEGQNVERITAIHLKIGELSDLEDEWIQRYFDYLSKNTIANGAKLIIQRSPVILQCQKCRVQFVIQKDNIRDVKCPECDNKTTALISGKEYHVKNMEVI
ncbi:MAG: hydrogenase maturation nickel metallochaperone HypA [Desulfobacula sp.]|nr:hydrogenase maturation nickel metallochaperone HypA [Desulfobacula sp.]